MFLYEHKHIGRFSNLHYAFQLVPLILAEKLIIKNFNKTYQAMQTPVFLVQVKYYLTYESDICCFLFLY